MLSIFCKIENVRFFLGDLSISEIMKTKTKHGFHITHQILLLDFLKKNFVIAFKFDKI